MTQPGSKSRKPGKGLQLSDPTEKPLRPVASHHLTEHAAHPTQPATMNCRPASVTPRQPAMESVRRRGHRAAIARRSSSPTRQESMRSASSDAPAASAMARSAAAPCRSRMCNDQQQNHDWMRHARPRMSSSMGCRSGGLAHCRPPTEQKDPDSRAEDGRAVDVVGAAPGRSPSGTAWRSCG